MSSAKDTVPCTVCVLTYNVERTLARCLQTLSSFDEVLLADGGSTDKTLEIAKRYGCRVISQSQRGKPIEDFAYERNRLTQQARNNWVMHIDADEAVSAELVEDIRAITKCAKPAHMMYEVQLKYTNGNLSQLYRTWKPIYRRKLFYRNTGACFTKPVHEQLRIDENVYSVGRIEGAWYTPLDEFMYFFAFKKSAPRNIARVNEWKSKNLLLFMRQCILPGVVEILRILTKTTVMRIKYPWKELVPMRIELFRIYDILFILWHFLKRYVQIIFRG